MSRCCALFSLVLLTWTWVVSVNPANGQIAAKAGKADKLVRVTYPVGDLIVPIQDHTAFSERKPPTEPREISKDTIARLLLKLIPDTVAKDTWESAGGRGSIQFFPMGLAVVVNQREDVHTDIRKLLAELRRLQDVQVSIQLRLVAAPPKLAERLLKEMDQHGQAVRAFEDKQARQTKSIVSVDAKRLVALLEIVQEHRAGHIMQFPKITQYNGQRAFVDSTRRSDAGAVRDGIRCDFWPVVDPERKNVRLTLDFEAVLRGAETDGVSIRHVANAAGTFVVPAGRTLIWRLGESASRQDLFLLATPTVIVIEEEEPIVLGQLAPFPRDGAAEEQSIPEPKKAPALRDPKERAIENRLRQPISLNLKEVPLRQAIRAIADLSGVPIVPDTLALDTAGIKMDTPSSIKVEDIDLKFALNILLRPLRLTYVIEDQVIKITTEPGIRWSKKTYQVGDLLEKMAVVPVIEGQTKEACSALMECIRNTIAKDKWEDTAGQASIQYFPLEKKLIMNQSNEIHEDIELLLKTLRRLYDVTVEADMRFVQVSPATAKRLLKDMGKSARTERGGASPFTSVDDRQKLALLETAQADSAAIIGQGPRWFLLSGQRIGFEAENKDTVQMKLLGLTLSNGELQPSKRDTVVQKNEAVRTGWRLELQTIASPDRRRVRTEMDFRLSAAEGAQKTTNGSHISVSLESGRTLVWHLGVQPSSRQHLFVLVTPRVIVREEEERIDTGDLPPIPGR